MTGATAIDEAEALRRILDIAAALLRAEDVGPEDHFLALGGDSLLAPMLARKIEGGTGTRPALADIFSVSFKELAKIVASRTPNE